MTHQQAIYAVEDLFPRVKNAADQTAEFVKYGQEHNLAPAQLHKVVQVFNTAMTLQCLEKLASRGDRVPLIDAESVLSSYAQHTPPVARAKAASEDIQDHYVVPMEKAAADGAEEWYEGTPAEIILAKRACTELSDLPESVDLFVDDVKDEVRQMAKEAALKCQQEDLDWTLVREDACAAYGKDEGLTLCGQLEGLMKASGFDAGPVNPDAVKLRALSYDKSGGLVYIDRLKDSLENIKSAMALRDTVTDAMDGFRKAAVAVSTKDPQVDLGRGHLEPDRFEPPNDGLQARLEAAARKEQKRQDRMNPKRAPKSQQPGVTPGNTSGKTPTDEIIESLALDESGGLLERLWLPAHERGVKKPTDSKGKTDSWWKTLKMNDLKQVDEAAKRYDEGMDPSILAHAKRIQDAKEDLQYSDSLNTLRYLLITDPIISKYPPNEVAEVFGTLHRVNPEITDDPVLVRHALREALGYGFLPTQQVKDISKIRLADSDRPPVKDNA